MTKELGKANVSYEKLKHLIQTYVPSNDREQQDQNMILSYMERFEEELLTRENGMAHFTASGFIVNKDLTKTLMIHHNIYNSWGWTGGHVDGETDVLLVAMKEAREETGVSQVVPLNETIQALDIIPVWPHNKNGKPISAHLHLNVTYLLVADESEKLMVKHDENSDVKWIPLEEVSHYCSEPEMMLIYDKLIKKAKEKTQI